MKGLSVILSAFVLVLTACDSAPTPAPTPVPTPAEEAATRLASKRSFISTVLNANLVIQENQVLAPKEVPDRWGVFNASDTTNTILYHHGIEGQGNVIYALCGGTWNGNPVISSQMVNSYFEPVGDPVIFFKRAKMQDMTKKLCFNSDKPLRGRW
jgi:hypothetical protein